MYFKGKRVLVSGGSGFIGSNLRSRLIAEEADLLVLVKYDSVVKNIRLAGQRDWIHIVEAYIRNPDSLRILQEIKPEIVFHLAAYNHVGDSFYHITEATDCNFRGSVNIMEAWQDYDRFVYVSTSEVNGKQEKVPFVEGNQPQPLSPYAIGKYAGELYAWMKYKSFRKPVVILPPFNAYGPFQSPRAITAEIILKCLKGVEIRTTRGLQTREFNFVGNHLSGFLKTAETPDAVGEILNLGCGMDIRIQDLVTMIHQLTESESDLQMGAVPDRPGEIWRMAVSSAKAKRILNWEPKVDIEEGVLIAIDWHRRYLQHIATPDSVVAELGRL